MNKQLNMFNDPIWFPQYYVFAKYERRKPAWFSDAFPIQTLAPKLTDQQKLMLNNTGSCPIVEKIQTYAGIMSILKGMVFAVDVIDDDYREQINQLKCAS